MAGRGLVQQVQERPSGLPGVSTQGYDLSLNRYKELVHDEVEHRPPLEILVELRAIEQEILQGIEELEGMLR
jgi:type I restriction enzyme M protein